MKSRGKRKCPVLRFQDVSEINALLDIYIKLKPRRVLEIGSAFGGTLWGWIEYAEKGTTIISVDMMVDEPIYGGRKSLEDSRALWDGWANESEVELKTIIGNSQLDETATLVSGFAPFNFIFIDAGHRFVEVATDFNLYWPMLSVGGIMAIHDIAYFPEDGHCIEVGKWWRDMKRAGLFGDDVSEILLRPPKHGIGVIKK